MDTFEPTKYATVEYDVTYCTIDGEESAMDIYYPAAGGPWPGLIFVHGGGWSEGDKDPLPALPEGFLVASLNYRMYPAYRFPAMIEDVKCAIRYLRAHAAACNLDPGRIALIGHSAGGHLVALAGLADACAGWDVGPDLEQSSQVQAVIDLSGPADLKGPFPEDIHELIHNVFGPEQLVSGSPVQYVHPAAPPFLIVHGDADPVVPVEQAHLFYDALLDAGAPVEKLIIHNAGHGLEPVGGEMSPTAEELFVKILTFLAGHLGA